MPSYYINDVAIEEYGLTLEKGGPIMPRLTINRDRQPWPGRTGGLDSPFGTVEPFVLRFQANGNVETVAARTALVDWLLDLVSGSKELRDRDTPDRVMRGKVRVFDTSVESPAFVNIKPTVVVEFECSNIARWDVHPQSVVLGSTPVQIACGNLPHGGRLYLTGAAAGALSSEVRIQYRGITGLLLNELVVLPALSSGEHAIIDFDAQQIVKVDTSNAQTAVDGWLTGGDFFRIVPRGSNRRAGVFGTLSLSSGAGVYVWRRNWVS